MLQTEIITNKAKGIMNTANKSLTNIMNNNTLRQLKNLGPLFFTVIIISILLVLTLYYIQSKHYLNTNNCLKLQQFYKTPPKLYSIANNPKYNKHGLRDFTIKTAYNCCCSGELKHDYVNLCALSNCISQGVRCLDLEIYSIDNKPVVAASSSDDYNTKETYNSIPIKEVFDTIAKTAFSAGSCPNPNDPIILHFRIMSNNSKMYDKLAEIISITHGFNSKTLGKNYSYEYTDGDTKSKNLGAVPISNFAGKIIIMIDGNNTLYQHTKLNEYINIASGSVFMHILRFKDIQFNPDINLKVFNKKNMSIVLPDTSISDANPNFARPHKYGCQFIAMSFQNLDSNLISYNKFFETQNTAFVLK